MADMFGFSLSVRSHNLAHWILTHPPSPFSDFSVSFKKSENNHKKHLFWKNELFRNVKSTWKVKTELNKTMAQSGIYQN